MDTLNEAVTPAPAGNIAKLISLATISVVCVLTLSILIASIDVLAPTDTSVPQHAPIVTSEPPSEPPVAAQAYCNSFGIEDDTSDDMYVNSIINKLRSKYDLCIQFFNPITPSESATSSFAPLTSADIAHLRAYLEVFDEEFGKYNRTFLKNVDLKAINFVKLLSVNGQNRAAAPEYIKEIVYYDVAYFDNVEYIRGVIHHEFYHNIEEAQYGDVYYNDPIWYAYNSPNFAYGSGGASCYDGLPEIQEGFVSAYAMCGLEEDKAETFGYLMITDEKARIKEMIKTDLILRKKVNHMIATMAELGLVINL